MFLLKTLKSSCLSSQPHLQLGLGMWPTGHTKGGAAAAAMLIISISPPKQQQMGPHWMGSVA